MAFDKSAVAKPTFIMLRIRDVDIAIVAALILVAGALFVARGWSKLDSLPPSNQREEASNALVTAASDAPSDQLGQYADGADGELILALHYLNGMASTRDPISGWRWIARSARHGSPVAQFMLGYLYEKGGTVTADPAQAMHWYAAAALQGNRKAMHNLAVDYVQGFDGKKNPAEAVRWFSRAANLGYVDSQFNLAVLYERGDGVARSVADAYKWYAIAGAQGDLESRARLASLRTQLSPAEVAAGQRAADSFRVAPVDPEANLVPKS